MAESHQKQGLGVASIGLGLVALWLGWEPARWLWQTWTDATWGSDGEWVFLAVAAVFVWSWRSRAAGASGRGAWVWLGFSALVRGVGHLLAVNVLSALMLCLDVYALGRMAGLKTRERAVEPAYLAMAFVFCLPMERIFQRVFGHALQWVSARGAYALLQVFEPGTSLEGMELSVRGTRVLVDLPCSGARSLTVLWVVFLLLASVWRPGWRGFGAGVVLTAVAALVSNTVRIFVLAEGIVHAGWLGIDVMAEPWHSGIGLLCLALVLPVIFGMRRWAGPGISGESSVGVGRDGVGGRKASVVGALMLGLGVGAMTCARPMPLDVSSKVGVVGLPAVVDGKVARHEALSALETDYFTAFGGAAARARYGDFVLLLVRTGSPVRHLHSPEECMAGAGWEVTRVGVTGRTAPGATWRIERGGQRLVVRATYVGSNGIRVATLEEAIWRWLSAPETTWTAVERAYPEWAGVEAQEAYDREVFHRLAFEEGA